VAFYLFLLKPQPWLAAAAVAALVVLTFVPFKFVHPFRVTRLRGMNIAAVLAWSGLAFVAVISDLDPGPWVTGALVVVAVYVVTVGLTDGLKSDDRAAA
jgi:phosphatidylcholine synthase